MSRIRRAYYDRCVVLYTCTAHTNAPPPLPDRHVTALPCLHRSLEWHPDRWSDQPPRLRDRAAEVFTFVAAAYAELQETVTQQRSSRQDTSGQADDTVIVL